MAHALEVYAGDRCVFTSDRRWLHPLFELEQFLVAWSDPRNELVVRDKVVGRAAALVLVYLGVGEVRAGVLSEGGKAVLERHGVPSRWVELVERIGCQTEELLATELDPERAWRFLRQRAGLTPPP
jgi:hypothetical protein